VKARIIAACRSAVAPRGGAFAALSIHDLAAPVIRALLTQAGLPATAVDEVIVSNALGAGGNPARRIALASELPETVAGLSIDRQCAGGLDAVLLARDMVASGSADVVIAGGAESYSRRPLRLQTFADGRAPAPYEQAPFTPWPERDPDMTEAAAALARDLPITREQQDAWAIESHAKARNAHFAPGELIPIEGLAQDSFTRSLSPALCRRAKVLCGSVTTANAAVAADGAAFCLVVSEAVAANCTHRGLEVIGGCTVGGQPECPGLAPVAAIEKSLRRAGVGIEALAVAEVMEAYAVQAIACVEGAGLAPSLVNRSGGALARGHPIGASGAINAVRLFHELRETGGIGLAAIAAAGGLGSALILGA
jgi:acetyl-CoA C-acetyltransferase